MKIKRREFVKIAGTAAALSFLTESFLLKKHQLLLSFSTLGCPDWDFRKIIDFANSNNYNGIEFRGIKRQLDLTVCDPFLAQNINATLSALSEKKLAIVNLGSSTSLHHLPGKEREKNITEAKSFIELASKLNCPYIRVFPNNLPKSGDRTATLNLIAEGLKDLGDYASKYNVTVLIETHGDLVNAQEIKYVMDRADHPHVGLVWDIVNMWSVTKVHPRQVYPLLKKYIRHTHIKDLKLINEKEQYTLFGEGQSPIFDAIRLLRNDRYKGYYSFEWEKLWHPEIAEPEIALSSYPLIMRKQFE